MRTLLKVMLGLIVLFIAVRVGWHGPIAVAVVGLSAYALYLFLAGGSTDRPMIGGPRFFVILAGGLTLLMIIWWVIWGVLFGELESTWMEEAPFLFDTPLLKLFWVALIGVILLGIPCALLFLGVGIAGARLLYSSHEGYKGHEWEAIRSVMDSALGRSKGIWQVRNGKAEVVGAQVGGLERFGGPGTLIVQEGNAVILEKVGIISRVVGKGLTWLEPFERVSMVVPLTLRTESIVVEKAATRDRILIEEFRYLVFHKVDAGPENERIRDGIGSYSKTILTSKVWSLSGNDWREGVRSVADTAARDVIGRYDLEQLIPISEQFRVDLKDALKQQINKVTKEAMGAEVVAVDIGEIVIPKEAEERLMARWVAMWDRSIQKTRAETEKTVQVTRAEARMETIQAISEGLRQLLGGKQATPQDVIALRFIEYLEERAKTSTGGADDDIGALLRLQSLEAVSHLKS